jgi:hypothetical protein
MPSEPRHASAASLKPLEAVERVPEVIEDVFGIRRLRAAGGVELFGARERTQRVGVALRAEVRLRELQMPTAPFGVDRDGLFVGGERPRPVAFESERLGDGHPAAVLVLLREHLAVFEVALANLAISRG